jgi:hypothetical protein
MIPRSTAVKDRCPPCARESERVRNRARVRSSTYTQVLNTSAWRRVRARAVRRDEGCVHAGADCSGRIEVHHLVPVTAGGEPFELDNLITLCQHHHAQHEAAIRRARKTPPQVVGGSVDYPRLGQPTKLSGFQGG